MEIDWCITAYTHVPINKLVTKHMPKVKMHKQLAIQEIAALFG